jgi:dTDP-4-dehydrorhamnose reductase
MTRILITGVSGLLGYNLAKLFPKDEFEIFGTTNRHKVQLNSVEEISVNLLEFNNLIEKIKTIKPDIILHCAGLTSVDECDKNPDLAYQIHVTLSEVIAKYSVETGTYLIHISTDHLWDGAKSMVLEETPICPLNQYGKTKGEGEKKVLQINSNALILRTNFYGNGLPWRMSLSDWILDKLKNKTSFPAFRDVHFTPISVVQFFQALYSLIQKRASGIFHLVGSERVSKFDFACKLADFYSLSKELIIPGTVEDAVLFAPRPKDMSLSSEKLKSFLGISGFSIEEGISTLEQKP